jgi:hypothetical protein
MEAMDVLIPSKADDVDDVDDIDDGRAVLIWGIFLLAVKSGLYLLW